MLDNEPIQPLYDLGIRQFIVIGMRAGKVLNTEKWPDAQFITIYQAMIWGSDRWYIEFYRTCEGVPADAWREGCTSCIEDEIPPG